MSIIDSVRNISSFARVSRQTQPVQGQEPYSRFDVEQGRAFHRARIQLLSLYRQLEHLAEVANVDARFKLDLPDARSAGSLGLDLTTTAASLFSSEEINTAPMSFSPFGPDWDGTSNALITIGGEYDGSHGSGDLTFEVRRAGTHGVDDLRIRVDDPQGTPIRTINIRANHAPDRQYDLLNGLYLTLGPGDLINRDTTLISVSDSVGASVDPNRPLGGIRNDNPNLQFGGPSVVDGSFDINGQTINVSTTDTLNDVISRINQSAASVTATYNSVLDRVEFLQDQTGSLPTIDLQNDTSNLLAAAKLSAAVVTPGIDPENEQVLDDVATFSSVQSGSVLINGQEVAFDTATDSLDSIITRINSSSTGAVARFEAGSNQVVIEAESGSSVLTLDDNSTGFFAALQLPDGRVDSEARGLGISRRRSYEIADAIDAAFNKLNSLFTDSSFANGGSSGFRAPLESALRSVLDGDSGDLFGMRIDLSDAARQYGGLAGVDRQTLTRNLQLQGDRVKDVLSGPDNDAGLIASLLLGTHQALTLVNQQLGISGSVIDVFA